MDKNGLEIVCQGNFVEQISLIIKETQKELPCEYNVGFIDGLIKAMQIINKKRA